MQTRAGEHVQLTAPKIETVKPCMPVTPNPNCSPHPVHTLTMTRVHIV